MSDIQKEQFWTIGNVLSIIGTVLAFAYLFSITFCFISKENVQFAQIGEGMVLGSIVGAVYGYHFGSSKDKKNQPPVTTDNSTNQVNIESPSTQTETQPMP